MTTLSVKTAQAIAYVLDTNDLSFTDHCSDVQDWTTDDGIDLDHFWNVRKDMWRALVVQIIKDIMKLGEDMEVTRTRHRLLTNSQLVGMVESEMVSMTSA